MACADALRMAVVGGWTVVVAVGSEGGFRESKQKKKVADVAESLPPRAAADRHKPNGLFQCDTNIGFL